MIYDALFRVNLGDSIASEFILAFNSVCSNGSSVLLLKKAFYDGFVASFVSSFVRFYCCRKETESSRFLAEIGCTDC